MKIEKYLQEKKAFVFELDDVLFPKKDYLLQVYYLFAQFIEYGEQISATEILNVMQEIYLERGEEALFEQTAERLRIPGKYKVNFDLLLLGARLPLKLLLYNEVLALLQAIVVERKQLFLFTDGDPAMQLNKIKQIEWNGMEKYLTVYFAAETASKPSADGLELLVSKHGLQKNEVLYVGQSDLDRTCASKAGIEFLNVNELLLT
ncbi:HAD family hydrolase [Pedobacter sp. GR22-6]|uniref:HAD family hydrolase n=1 Tax=Pedobacter sp. GR22-6 TaxID=3127957 RepID=UPI00307F1650